MTTWGNICRICSSPADYEVFAKIPNYLHATANDFLQWQKPINVLLEETTGLRISVDDGMPRFICALCISYLKHAASFREQVINNTLGLKAAQALHAMSTTTDNGVEQQDKDEKSLLITDKDLNYSEKRKTDANLLYGNESHDKVCKQLLNNDGERQHTVADRASSREQIRYLNLLFNKDNNSNASRRDKWNNRNSSETAYEATVDPFAEDFQTASSDDNEAGEQKLNYFSYREKNFEEDDIMDADELKDVVTINIPESCKERKCRACFRRFMFEESFKEHMETCIEYKFLITIEEINRLLDIRRGKAISPHEFIRRMIFCLRKTCEWLKANCGEMLLPDLLLNGGESGNKKRSESEGKSSTAEASSGGGGGAISLNLHEDRAIKTTTSSLLTTTTSVKTAINKSKMTDFTFQSSITRNSILAMDIDVGVGVGVGVVPATTKPVSGCVTPISFENNVLYEIERSQSRNNNKQEAMPNKRMTRSNVKDTPPPVQEQERITFLQKLQNAASISTPIAANCEPSFSQLAGVNSTIAVRKDLMPAMASVAVAATATPPTISKSNLIFSARCNLCDTIFATVAELEEHNALYHNAQQLEEQKLKEDEQKKMEEHAKIIALFEESSDD